MMGSSLVLGALGTEKEVRGIVPAVCGQSTLESDREKAFWYQSSARGIHIGEMPLINIASDPSEHKDCFIPAEDVHWSGNGTPSLNGEVWLFDKRSRELCRRASTLKSEVRDYCGEGELVRMAEGGS